MFWVIAILVLLVLGVMGIGDKEKSVHRGSSSQSYTQTKSELGRSISEGLATFNAGLKKINDELQLRNQVSELLIDFSVKNRTAVLHYECLVKYVEMTEKFADNFKVTSVKSFIEKRDKYLSSLYESLDMEKPDRISIFNKHVPKVKDDESGFISSIEDKNPEHYDKPVIGAFDRSNEALKTVLLEKIMEIIDERKSDLRDLYRAVSYGDSKALFDGLLDDLNEKELFYHLIDKADL